MVINFITVCSANSLSSVAGASVTTAPNVTLNQVVDSPDSSSYCLQIVPLQPLALLQILQ